MTWFWFILVASLALVFAAVVALLDRWQDSPPSKVSASDWQRVANEKEQEDFARRRTLGRATDSRTAAHTRVIR